MFCIKNSYSGLTGYSFASTYRKSQPILKISLLLITLFLGMNHSHGQIVSDVVEISRVSSSNEPEASMKLYPNPASEKVMLEVEHAEEIQGLKIFTLTGQLVKNYPYQRLNRFKKIDISLLVVGTYVIQVQTEKGRISKKLMISRR